MATILPLLKKDNPNFTKNYRPMSLLSVVSKILEKKFYEYVFNHFKDNYIIKPNQYGFLPNHSTVSQLTEILDYLHSKIVVIKIPD